MTSSVSKSEIAVGDHFMVKRADGSSHWVEIIEVRKVHFDKDPNEYYVHYKGCDRRLDEWILGDRIDLASRRTKPLIDQTDWESVGIKKMTRSQKRRYEEINHVQLSVSDMDPTTAMLEKEHEAMTKVKYINCIQFGKYDMDTWYYSPYPDEYEKQPKLFICEYCVKYMRLENTYRRHLGVCTKRQPPGDEIYRKGKISVFEVDGAVEKLYCQCVCLMSKLFLDHKTLFYDVSPFLFYIVCEVDRLGAHFIGYFSKEKDSQDNNNLACIMVLPPFQRNGYGKFLIQISYELAKRENKIGTPEKPLSDLGKRSYRSYWAWVLLDMLTAMKGTVMTNTLSSLTMIAEADIIDTLRALNLLKYWNGHYVVCVTPAMIQECMKNKIYKKPDLIVDPSCIRWAPPVFLTKERKGKGNKRRK